MSDFSLTLVLQIKTSKIINDMAKVQQKSEKISAFGGIFFVLDKFDRILSSVIDSHLGLRSKLIGYQYSEIIRAVFSVFCCGGDCMDTNNSSPRHFSLKTSVFMGISEVTSYSKLVTNSSLLITFQSLFNHFDYLICTKTSSFNNSFYFEKI